MITELRLRDFKNFKDATLRLGPFTVLVGANASGKSNIRDAFRFLHGVGRGYKLADIIGGKYGAGGQSEWAQLRGAANEIMRFGAAAFSISTKFSLAGAHPPSGRLTAEYHIEITTGDHGPGAFEVVAEQFKVGSRSVYNNSLLPDQDPQRVTLSEIGTKSGSVRLLATLIGQPALSRISDVKELPQQTQSRVQEVLGELASIRFLDPVPDQMRKPAFPGQNVLGDGGEYLSTVLEDICKTPARKALLIDWIQELTPMDVVDFEFPRDPSGLVHLVLKERSGLTVSAYSASDGTLRLLALLAAILGKHPAKLYFLEEIETGIHPARLSLLLDLIQRQTAKNEIQIIATTHSPALLQMISDSTFNHTSVVYRPQNTDHAIIRPVSELPDAPRLRSEQGLGALHASGWMEDVLFFSGENEQAAAK